jgi:hypothetical protein
MGQMSYAPIAEALRAIGYKPISRQKRFPTRTPNVRLDKLSKPSIITSVETSMLKHTLIHPTINAILGQAGHHAKNSNRGR